MDTLLRSTLTLNCPVLLELDRSGGRAEQDFRTVFEDEVEVDGLLDGVGRYVHSNSSYFNKYKLITLQELSLQVRKFVHSNVKISFFVCIHASVEI